MDNAVLVVMQTEVGLRDVLYRVVSRTLGKDHTEWEKRVPFGAKATNRPGGYAFRRAALEQEEKAHLLAWGER